VVGRIELICGCMFSGKTTLLIGELRAAADAGRRTCAFKHVIDNRYAADELVTHDQQHHPALAVPDSAELLRRATAAGAEVVGIDEGHFFGRSLLPVCGELRGRGVRVIVAGLHHDAWGRPFPPFPELRPLADAIRVQTVPCPCCGRPAEYSQRLTAVTDPFMIGGLGEYEPRCAACFRPLPPPAPRY